MKRCLIVFVFLALYPFVVSAQTVFRCGPDGSTYSQTPCEQGKAVDVRDERTKEQQAAAEKLAKDVDVQGRQLEHERRAKEAKNPPAMASGFHGRPAAVDKAAGAPAKGKKKKNKRVKAKSNKEFTAAVPQKRKKSSSK